MGIMSTTEQQAEHEAAHMAWNAYHAAWDKAFDEDLGRGFDVLFDAEDLALLTEPFPAWV